MRTKERLARVLRHAGLPGMAAKAMLGCYDDYESMSPTPIRDLVRDLQAARKPDLAQQAMDGKWDGTAEEAKAWYEREGKVLMLDGELEQ